MLEKAKDTKKVATSVNENSQTNTIDAPALVAPTSSNSSVIDASERRKYLGSVAKGLSGKLLILTMAFVMFAEILILVPSIANFRNVWLQNHLDTAESASIVYLDSSDTMLSEKAQAELLAATQSLSVSIKENGVSRLMANMPYKNEAMEHIDRGAMAPFETLASSFSTLFFGGDKTYHVYGPLKSRIGEMHLVQEDKYLRKAMWDFARNILLISLGISFITAGLVFLSLYWMIVMPIIKLSSNMDAFSKTPENANLVYKPTGRSDEIGTTEVQLAALQTDLQATLRQKQHLADLGLAVSKINHDLRNILASAQLFSDRLTTINDPTVQKFAPKLIRTIDRAVEYTREVLAYGKATESQPELRVLRLHTIVDDVADVLGFGQPDVKYDIEWKNLIDKDHHVQADSEQLFRAILNLSRNACQAMQTITDASAVKKLEITAEVTDDEYLVRVIDTGPGIPQFQQDKLFQAFQGSNANGGTGLGLAIAAELIRAHGGSIAIERTNSLGSVFLIRLPHHD